MRRRTAYCLVMATVTLAGPAAADTNFYVRGDGAGSDSYAGTNWATAWATLQKAMSSVPLQSGADPTNTTGPAHIYVQASSGSQTYGVASRSLGYYSGPGSGMDVDFQGGWENVDTAPAQTGVSVVRSAAGNQPGFQITQPGSHNAWKKMAINGFLITNVTRGAEMVMGSGGDHSSQLLWVSNTTIYALNDGLYVDYPKPYTIASGYGGYTRVTAENVKIVAGQGGSGQGVWINGAWMGSRITATGNDPATGYPRVSSILTADGCGVRTQTGCDNNGAHTFLFSNVVVYGCSSNGILLTSGAGDAVQATLWNCTIADNNGDGFRLVSNTAGSWCNPTNCIFANNAGHGLNLGTAGGAAADSTEGYNDFFNDDLYTNGAAKALAASDVTGDPLFTVGTTKPYPYYTLASAASPCYLSGSDGSNRGAYQDMPNGTPRITNAGGATNVQANSAWINGVLTYTGAAPATVWAFWGPTDGGIVPGHWANSIDFGARTQGDEMTSQLIGLIPDTTYYYRFYAQNSFGESWAAPSASFRTLSGGLEFGHRMKIAFPNYSRSGPLTNFPALVVFHTNLSGFAYEQFESPTAGDLRFYDAMVSNTLNYEIESWDTNTNSYVWVQVPVLTNNAFIWAYWGHINDTSPPACTTNGATWDSNYKAVWHLGQSPTNPSPALTDSTANANHGTDYGTMGDEDRVAGLADGALDLDGGDDYVRVPNGNSSLRFTGNGTVESWVKLSPSWSGGGYVFQKQSDGSGGPYEWGMIVNVASSRTGGVSIVHTDGGAHSHSVSTLTPLDTDRWYHLVEVWESPYLRVYLDGVENNSANVGTGTLRTGTTMSSGIGVCNPDGTRTSYFKGGLDEVRVSNLARSSNWIWAAWLNMASNSFFNTCDPVEDFVRVRNLPATNVTPTAAFLNGRLLSTGTAENPDVFVCWGTNDFGISGTSAWPNVESLGASWGKGESFSASVSTLESNVLYYYRCYASNSTGQAWASWAESFRSVAAPAITNRAATGVSKASATLNGYLSGGPADVYFYWGLADGTNDPASWGNTALVSAAVSGWVSTTVTVRANGTYYYRCFATNDYGFGWADSTTNFTTPYPEVTVWADGTAFYEYPGGTLTVTARLDTVSAADATVYFGFSGTASTGADYTVSATSLVVAAGLTTGALSFAIVNDTTPEPIETYTVQAVSAAGAVIGSPGSVSGTITSDDPAVTNQAATSITDQAATLNGYMTYGYTGMVYVFWGATDGGTNPAAWDNTNAVGARSEGAFSSAISSLWGNKRYYYRCFVTNSGGGAWAPSTTNFTTLAPYVSIADAPSVTEGNSGTTDMVFTVSLTTPSATNLWVPYASSNRAAVAGSDYTAVGGALLFSPGDTAKTITVVVNGDTADESPYEDLYVYLYSATNGTLVRSRGYGMIVDDDLATSGWLYKMKISFTNYNRPETLTNFPALVVLSTNLSGFAYQLYSTNGYDLRFMDSTETSVLMHEVDRWDVSGRSYVWVKVPQFTNNCSVWAYWGNKAVTAPASYTTNGDVWTEGFAGVWHFGNGSALSAGDSTANTYNGTITGSTATNGIIDGAGRFNGSSDYVRLPMGTSTNLNATCTIICWAYISQFKECDIVQRGFGGVGGGQMLWLSSGGGNVLYWGPQNGNVSQQAKSTALTALGNQWVHIACTKTSNVELIYINGALNATCSGAVDFTRTDDFYVGYGRDGYFNGAVDDLRISSVARSSNWVWACWMSGASNSAFNSYDPAQSLSSLPAIRNEPATNVAANSACFNGTLVSTGEMVTAVSLYWGRTDGGTDAGSWQHVAAFGDNALPIPAAYSTNLTGLVGDSPHFYRYYATNSAGGSWAPDTATFTTLTDLSHYPRKMKITFSGYNRSEPLTNFPALVVFSQTLTNFLYADFASTNAYDLRFAEATETTLLNYEIERWDTNASSYVWVQVPELTNNCYIWAYWGYPTATNQPAYTTNGATWSQGFAGVWHLNDTANNAVAGDSTSNRVNGTNYNSTNAVGVVASGQGFDGTGDYFDLGNASATRITGSQTISMWLRPASFATRKNPFAKAYGGEFATTIETDGRVNYYYGTTGSDSGTGGSTYQGFTLTDTLALNTWSHVAIIRNLGAMQLQWVKNGTATNQTAALFGAAVAGSSSAYIGEGYVDAYLGLMDELRLSSMARSTNWVWAEYLNMASNSVFNAYAPVLNLSRPTVFVIR